MKKINHYTYSIRNLNCVNCATRIENKINNLTDVSEVHLDLVNNKLMVASNLNNKEVLNQVRKIATDVEPGTKIKETQEDDESISKFKIFRIISGLLIFFSTFIPLLSNYSVILFILSYIIVGIDVIYKAFRNITKGNFFDENFLMMLATFAAIYIKSYEEAVAVMLFYEIGELMQDLAVNKSRRSIKKLIDLKPKYANLKVKNEIKSVRPEEVRVDNIIIVKPGEQVPLDGIIIKGNSSVDTHQVTGESIPKNIESGNEILAGFINQQGIIEVRVTKPYNDSTVNKILELVQNAQKNKAPIEKFITRFARFYTPIVIFLAILTVLIPKFFVNDYQFNDYLYRGAIFLVVACPCALVISIPLTMFGGIGASSKHGILVKGGNYLDLISKVGIIVFDKTGTLTKGNFVVTKVICNNISEKELIEKTILAESLSNHAIGKAIVNYRKIDIDNERIKKFKEVFGKGVIAFVDNEEILVGNAKLLKDYNVDFPNIDDIGTIVYVAMNRKYRGCFIIEDEIKKEAILTIERLKKLGISQTIILTGDNREVGEYVKEKLNIDKVYANLLPENKLTILQDLKIKYPKNLIMFVGDGVNDTPVLTYADIGVSMGALGSDAAIEVSDCVIMNDDLDKLVVLNKISSKTKVKITQNIILALGVKFLVLGLSAFGLTSMWMAIFSDVGVALLTVFNSILILKYKF